MSGAPGGSRRTPTKITPAKSAGSAGDSKRRHCVYAPVPRWLPHTEEVRLTGSKSSPLEVYDDALAKERTKTNQHMGQRKLLISEVQLLTVWYAQQKQSPIERHPVVVYVGAAPGSHDIFLHRMFPHVRFVLYDGAPFDERLREKRDVFELRNEYFTDAHCTELVRRTAKGAPGPLSGRPLIFVCDIRSDAADDDRFESQVMRDMASQRRWAEALRPELSLLKFRLPYTLTDVPGAKVPYLKGLLLWGVWATQDSGETRLLVKKADVGPKKKDAVYDYAAYEGAKTFHNHYTRRTCFADSVPPELAHLVFGPDNAYCSCFDCLTELVTYKKYLEQAAERASSPFRSVDDIVRAYNASTNVHGNHGNQGNHGHTPAIKFPMAGKSGIDPQFAPAIERMPFAKKPTAATKAASRVTSTSRSITAKAASRVTSAKKTTNGASRVTSAAKTTKAASRASSARSSKRVD